MIALFPPMSIYGPIFKRISRRGVTRAHYAERLRRVVGIMGNFTHPVASLKMIHPLGHRKGLSLESRQRHLEDAAFTALLYCNRCDATKGPLDGSLGMN